MRTFVIGSFTLVALNAGSVLAADLPVKAPRYKAPPVAAYSWTGCYVGGNAGYGWQHTDNTLVVTNGAAGYFADVVIPGVSRNGSGSLNSNGFTGGVQVGCNVQQGAVVWGAETDFNSFRQGASFGGGFNYFTPGFPPDYFLTVEDSKKWLWTLRGRVGLTHDRMLFYITGGLAALKVDFDEHFNEPRFATQVASFSGTKFGWTIGAGIEAALWDCCWTAKLEYLYTRIDAELVSSTLIGIGGAAGNTATLANSFGDINLSTVRLGLNYRFGNYFAARY